MKIYTKTGDGGSTSLVGGKRVAKDSDRLEAYGTVDELNSQLGMLRALASGDDAASAEFVATVQSLLFNIGAYLATDNAADPFLIPSGLSETHIEALEREIDRLDLTLEPLRSFILPGGCQAAAQAAIARTVCRRAERRVIALTHADITVSPLVITYLNRLSDYLFTLSRHLNHLTSTPETPWIP